MVTNGRIQQSLAYWCLNATDWQWNIDRICETAVRLGCPSVELAPPELWPVVAKYGLRNLPRAERHAGSRVRQGPEQSAQSRGDFRAHQGHHRSLRRVLPSPTSSPSRATNGWIPSIPPAAKSPLDRRRARTPLRDFANLPATPPPKRHHRPGTTQYPRRFTPHEGPSRVSGRRHRLLRRNRPPGRFPARQIALRRLSRRHHERRCDPPLAAVCPLDRPHPRRRRAGARRTGRTAGDLLSWRDARVARDRLPGATSGRNLSPRAIRTRGLPRP